MRTLILDLAAVAIGTWLLFHAIVAAINFHADVLDAVVAVF